MEGAEAAKRRQEQLEKVVREYHDRDGRQMGSGGKQPLDQLLASDENVNDIDMHGVIDYHNTQYASVDTINRDNERSQPKRQHNGVRDAKVPKRQHNGVRDAKALVGYGGGG
jgi:hypothetical protein